MKYLFIAEKPSLMRDVQSCYRKHRTQIEDEVGKIEFCALAGHACRNLKPNDYPGWDGKWWEIQYPMIPGKWGVKPIKGKTKMLQEIKKKAAECDGIIVGTDSDTEGYGIYFLIEQYLGLQKKKALRFMEHSLTDKEILESLLSMTDYHTDPVHQRFTASFLLRSRADWLYGMNITRLMSIKTGNLMTVGRVKAPTIKLVYDNSVAIEQFVPRQYFQLQADYGGFQALLCGNDKKPKEFAKEEPISFPAEGIVSGVQSRRKSVHAPKLYDLASLQMDAGQMFGYSPQKTLDTVQSLYEKHKAVSYPRTQCRYVSSEKAKEFPALLQVVSVFPDLPSGPAMARITQVQRDRNVVNDKEVEKESHDALLPTTLKPDLSRMTAPEKEILNLIYNKFYAQFMTPMEEETSTIEIMHGEAGFLASGKRVIDPGWRQLYGIPKEYTLPNLKQGDRIMAKQFRFLARKTQPPKRLTQAGLISAMEHFARQIEDPELRKSLAESKGIGTAATRATIIGDIIKRGYVEVKKNSLYITEAGKKYVEAMEGVDIISPVFAGQMDHKIKQIQRGEQQYQAVYKEILKDLYRVCAQVEQAAPEVSVRCPFCGMQVSVRHAGYFCSCGLQVYRKICGRSFSDEEIMALLNNRVLPQMQGFVSKNGKPFSAGLALGDDKKISFVFDN
ncbi:topoisomerase C-terminal repeat-containing protein [Ruminococcus sp. CLA-AA-H200]|uniref:DNA topoisomerase n=1 Tax=Ruminococcus turbiniformis TaxID=2881258 RepID=A0ABS8FX02_9FIRM|nr:type IA DNA topoisomerase [Ruminococcus turbiniformis]MCC2254556.1 topoisomerase C-terminal repeat-containing protein [Ruminococcus turbiniformis]